MRTLAFVAIAFLLLTDIGYAKSFTAGTYYAIIPKSIADGTYIFTVTGVADCKYSIAVRESWQSHQPGIYNCDGGRFRYSDPENPTPPPDPCRHSVALAPLQMWEYQGNYNEQPVIVEVGVNDGICDLEMFVWNDADFSGNIPFNTFVVGAGKFTATIPKVLAPPELDVNYHLSVYAPGTNPCTYTLRTFSGFDGMDGGWCCANTCASPFGTPDVCVESHPLDQFNLDEYSAMFQNARYFELVTEASSLCVFQLLESEGSEGQDSVSDVAFR